MYSTTSALILLTLLAVKFSTAVLTPEDEDFFGREADRYDWSKHPCRRKCQSDSRPQPMTCRYVFVVEQTITMSKACYDCPNNVTDCFRPHCVPADGVRKLIYTVNRRMPGPPIEVCENDVIEVEVRNRMLSESTSIHWHGVEQVGTPYMDGVPYVTQCPILPGENFRYVFNASRPGTFFWHSHIGSQKTDGLFGPMIVNRYDDDAIERQHVVLVNDWMHVTGSELLAREYHDRATTHPDNILVNGLGRVRGDDGSGARSPTATFSVEKGKKYKFRLINAGAEDCPIEMSIDDHAMTLVGLDGHAVVPTEVDAITTYPGERVDFTIETSRAADNYWMRFRGYSQCGLHLTHQVAILHYEGLPIRDPEAPVAYRLPLTGESTRVLNPYHNESSSNLRISDLTAADENDASLSREVDHRFYLNFDFHDVDNYDFARAGLYGHRQVPDGRWMGSLQMNHITLRLPAFPLLSQRDSLEPDSFCNATHPPRNLNCIADYCACTHVLRVRLDSTVELVLIDEGRSPFGAVNHPFHLHGHAFRVVAEAKLSGWVTLDRVKRLDDEGRIERRLDRAPVKDTTIVASGGYTVVRFRADNPGYWLFHCHFEQHNNVGMSLVFKVGEHEDFPSVPKGFPRCGGGYVPLTV